MHYIRSAVLKNVRLTIEHEFVGFIDGIVFVAKFPETPTVFDVVGLIEDDGVRLAEVGEAKGESQQAQSEALPPAACAASPRTSRRIHATILPNSG
jgi:hypothetical protein